MGPPPPTRRLPDRSTTLLTARSGRVAAARRLARRATRTEERRFLVEGPQAVREALATVGLTDLFVTAEGAQRHPDLVAAVPHAHEVDDGAMAALAETVTPQGLVGIAPFVDVGLDTVLAQRPRLVAVLAAVRDPGNAGTVLRAADAAGADAVVVTAESVDVYNGKCVRATAGSLFHLPVVVGVPAAEAITALRQAGVTVLAAAGDAALDLDTALDDGLLSGPTAWVFGNEAWGLPAELQAAATAAVRVPIHGRAESLNLATAAAVCLYASARAHRTKPA